MPPYYQSKYATPSSLETRSAVARSQAALQHLKVDGLRVKYSGPGEDDTQAATIRANAPCPHDVPLFYFEVEIVSKGQYGYIGVGFQTEDVILARLPGWENHSYGYHGDDGFAFAGSGAGRPYGPNYAAGDTIGALFNRADRSIRFYKNGADLGVAFADVADERLFPCVGLRSRGEEVVVNFGATPFKGNFEGVQNAYRDQVVRSVTSLQLPLLSSRHSPLLPALIHDHLLHHRCWQTAAIIARDLLSPPPAPQAANGTDGAPGPSSSSAQPSIATSTTSTAIADVAARQRVYDLVVAGDITQAVAVMGQQHGPRLLGDRPPLDFKLKVAQFCELVRAGNAVEALSYGRAVLAPHSPKGSAEEELLSDALSLLAYEQPEASPCGHLLRKPTRVALAEEVNGAILAHHGQPATSPLERLYQQAVVTVDMLKQYNHPRALAVDPKKVCFGPGPLLSSSSPGGGPASSSGAALQQ